MRLRKILMTGMALLLAGLVAWWYFTPPTLAGEGRRLASCVVREDAPCVFAFVSQDERKAYDLDEAKVAGILRTFVHPAFSGVGTFRDQDYPTPTQARNTVDRTYDRPGRDPVHLNAETSMTAEGIKGVDVISGLVLDSIDAEYRRPGLNNECARVAGLRAKQEAARGLGLAGFYQPRESPPFLLYDEYLHYHEDLARESGVSCPVSRSPGS